MDREFSLILPAKNEATGLSKLLPLLVETFPSAQIIVVDDGSTDQTAQLCQQYPITLIRHAYSLGNGAAIKAGARAAQHDILVCMDADGQHNPNDIPRLLAKIDAGFEMVVGARTTATQASVARSVANYLYNRIASVMTGYKIDDLTSGFRAARARHFRQFLYLLPNGFSYPTTITMAFFRSGYPVTYIPIEAARRSGKSHIRLFKDGLRFFIIIMKIGALFSPMRLFLPISSALFLVGCSYYAFTYLTMGRFTNMSALLFMSSLSTFLIGIVSEQISSLHYKGAEDNLRRTQRGDRSE